MTSYPRCAAKLRDGQPCGRTVADGSEFCVHHRKLADEHGPDVVKQGLPRHRAARTASDPVIVATEPASDEMVATIGDVDPASVRPRLAEAAAEGLDGIRKTLLDAAPGAVGDHWVTFECSDCGKRKRVELPVPDVRARVAAIELLLREGLGRPPQAEETPSPRLPMTAAAVARMGWDDLQMLGATIFAEEIASISIGEGETLLRERLASLGAAERRALRGALDSVGPFAWRRLASEEAWSPLC
jgi:hypothetical protein